MTMSIVNGVVTEEPGKIRFHKRGPRAWDNFFEMPAAGLLQGGTTRLLVHSVADATTKQWLPKVRSFLEHLQAKQITIEMPSGIDKELAEYLDHMCYGLQKSPSIGALLFFGLLCLAPELKGRLPLSARSLKAWGKLAISCEGGPLPEEIVYLIAVEMIRKGFLYQGAWVLCQYDVYGREQDMEQLDTSDISYDGQHMGLVFGEAARGQSAKTGHNQGAVVRRGLVIDIFLALQEAAKGSKVFPIGQPALRKIWHQTLRDLKLEFAGPPHSIRHSGPSEDLARGRASLEQVRRRGRWKSMDSVQRYTKSFALTRFRAKVPPETEEKAKEVHKNLRRALLHALEDHRRTPVGRNLWHALRAKKGADNFADTDPVIAMMAKKTKKKAKKQAETSDTDQIDEGLSSETSGWATD